MIDIKRLREDLINYFGVFSQFDDKFYVTVAEMAREMDSKLITMLLAKKEADRNKYLLFLLFYGIMKALEGGYL